jgi:uncharacterized protein Yka (UPF0111/DUF47 family)
MTTAVDIADKVAEHAEEIASSMAVYHASPEYRDEMIARVEFLMLQLSSAFLHLTLRHKAEAFEAKL